MKKLFLLIPAMLLTMMAYATTPGLNKTTPVTLMAADATLSANGSIVTDSITWSESTIHEGFAKWRVNIADMGYYSVTLDMRSNNTFFFRISVVDPATGDTLRQSRSPKKESDKVYAAADCGTLNLRGLEAGEYDIVVTDTIQWSHGKVASMTLTYAGGLTINIPTNPLNGADAVLGKTGEKYMLRTEEGYLKSHDNVDPTSEYAYWYVRATQGGNMKVTANVAATSSTTHDYHVELYSNLSASALSTTAETASSSSTGARALTPELVIPEAGDYYIKLVNHTQYSSAILSSIAFEYKGGNPIEIPQTLTPDDAMLSDRAWVDKTGAVDSILFTPRGSEGYNDQEWVKWRVKVTTQSYYNFTAHVCRPNGGQKYEIKVFNSDETVEKISYTNESMSSGNQTISSGKVELTPGVYVIKVRNTYNHAESRLLKVVATYEGGKAINIPQTLTPDDVILSPRAWVDKTGAVDSILFTPRGSEGYNDQEWAKWKVNVTDQAYYNFTAHVCRPNGGQKYEIKVLSEDESVEKISNTNESMAKGDQTISSGKVELTPGVYVVKVRNTYNNAESRLLKVVATYEGGKTQALPGILYGADAVLEKIDPSTKMMIRLENGDIQSSNNVNHLYEYAYWKVHAKEGEMTVMLNIPEESTSQHQYQVALYNNINDAEPVVPAVSESKTGSTGVFAASTLNIATEGDYYIKLVNTVQYSSSTIRSISIAPIVTIDEDETNEEAVIGANDGNKVNVQLNRTLTANMYNTICLPFAVNEAEMERVFPDAVVKELSSSSIEEGDFVLNLNFSAVSEMEAGVPYIIKPAANIANPKFIGVTIDKTLNPVNTARANFIGNFAKGTIPASENNLFMGANNTLYFPTVDTEILGMRGYFVIHDAPAGVIQRARIVEADAPAVTTEINCVDAKANASVKTIENGQLVIIRDGKKYNVMGVRMK